MYTGKAWDAGVIKGKIVICDATYLLPILVVQFIKAHSKQDPKDDSKGYRLGYKLHLAVEADSDLSLAVIAASANENEKKHAPKHIEKAIQATDRKLGFWLLPHNTQAESLENT